MPFSQSLKKRDVNFAFRLNLLFGMGLALSMLYNKYLVFDRVILCFVFPLGLALIYFCYWVVALIFKKDILYILTQANLVVMLFPVFTQMGCFHAGCCYGKPYDGIFSVTYGAGSDCSCSNTPFFAIRILEALAFLILFILVFVFSKKHMKKIYIPLFALLNFAVYYGGMALGANECNFLYSGGKNYAAFVSVVLLAMAVALIIISIRKEKIK